MRLERSDGHAELVTLLRVLDAELQRGAGQADERSRHQHAPLVDGAVVELDGAGATGDDGARPDPQRTVGDRGVAEVVQRAERRGFGLDHHELVVVEPDDDRRDGSGRHEAGEPVRAPGAARRPRPPGARRRGDRRSSAPMRRPPPPVDRPPTRRRAGSAPGPRRSARRRARGRAGWRRRRRASRPHPWSAPRAHRTRPTARGRIRPSPRTPARPKGDTPWRRTRGTSRRGAPARR